MYSEMFLNNDIAPGGALWVGTLVIIWYVWMKLPCDEAAHLNTHTSPNDMESCTFSWRDTVGGLNQFFFIDNARDLEADYQ